MLSIYHAKIREKTTRNDELWNWSFGIEGEYRSTDTFWVKTKTIAQCPFPLVSVRNPHNHCNYLRAGGKGF